MEVEVTPWGPSEAIVRQLYELPSKATGRASPEAGGRRRLLNYELVEDPKVGPTPNPPTRLRATIYDYDDNRVQVLEQGVDGGDVVVVTESGKQPVPNGDEFLAAVDLLKANPELGPAISEARLHPYRPMPPLVHSELPNGATERILAIGLLPNDGSRLPHEIVGANLSRESLVRWPGRAPEGSMAADRTCGIRPANQLSVRQGTPGQFLVTVREGQDELWRFLAVRPAASSGTNGSGIELRAVDYRGVRMLDRAHVPILNVRYDNDGCGPFRDWQWQESWIQAEGTDIAPGFRRCDEPARTILESGQDEGNFLGVALYTVDQETVLVSEMEAGWYRYISEWRLHNDGTIRPRFGFSAVTSSCVCIRHHHHVYWRFDFDIRTQQNNQVREFNDPPLTGPDNWHVLRFETRRTRDSSRQRRWSVMNMTTGEGYLLTPGPQDGVADDFGVGDLWALQYRDTEIDDGQGFTTDPALARAQLDRFVDQRAPIDDNDVVVWYSAHFSHEVDEEGSIEGHRVGPELRPINWSGGGGH